MSTLRTKWVRSLGALIILTLIGLYLYDKHIQAQYATLYLQNANYGVQIGMYELFKTSHADVVMLGNSLTYNANWSELLGRKNIVNRGIVNDITAGFLHRLAYVYSLQPKMCFIEGGVNDLYANYSVNQIYKNYVNIIDTLRAHHIVPIIQSTLFVSAKWPQAAEKNKDIQNLDDMLAEFGKQHSIEFLNINSLVSKNGFLQDGLTYDGMHLNANGYALWTPEVERMLTKHEL